MVYWIKALIIATSALSCLAVGDSNRTYTVGVESFPYYPHYETKGTTFGGYARDILDAFAEESGYKFEYRPMPYRRVVKHFLNQDIDFQYPDNEYWLPALKSNSSIYYSEPAVSFTDGVHVREKNKGRGIENVKSIGTLVGFSPIQYFPLEQKGLLRIFYSSTVEGLIGQVHRGRLDGLYLNVDVIRHYEKNKQYKLVFDDSLPHINSGFSLSSIMHQNIILDFNSFLKKNGHLVDKIKMKYGLQ